jgi:anti-anti-sigma factor
MECLKIVAMTDPPGLQVVGEVDMASVELLKEALDESTSPGGVTLDLAELTFIDSSGIHCLVQHALGRNGSGPLTLVNVQPNVRRTLEIVGVAGGGIPNLELRNGTPDG